MVRRHLPSDAGGCPRGCRCPENVRDGAGRRQEAIALANSKADALGADKASKFRTYAETAGDITDDPNTVEFLDNVAADPRRGAEFQQSDVYGPEYGAYLSPDKKRYYRKLQQIMADGASNAGTLTSLGNTLTTEALRSSGIKKEAPEMRTYVMTRVNEYLASIPPGQKGDEGAIRNIIQESLRDASEGWFSDTTAAEMAKGYSSIGISIGDATKAVRAVTGSATPANMEAWRPAVQAYVAKFKTTNNLAETFDEARRAFIAKYGEEPTPQEMIATINAAQ